ncbi:MAG: hypothetical protein NTW87_26610 [Planctomycetota bacterium]|nr:hypothetical protein [Planctomycetota bacterium]
MATSSRADTVVLLDGTQHEGEIVSQTKDTLTLRVRLGGMTGSIVIPKADIAALHVKPLGADPVAAAAQALRKEAEAVGGDNRKKAEAWVRLGDFYQRHPGYSAQGHEAYVNALLWDPDQPAARTALGYIKTESSWAQKPKPRPPAPSPKPDVAAVRAQAAGPKPDDGIVIGLRRDEELVKKLLADQEARKRGEMELERRQPQYRGNGDNYGGWPGYYNGGLYYSGYGTGGEFVYISPAPAYVYPGSGRNGWPTPLYGYGYGGSPWGGWNSGSYSGGGCGLGFGFGGRWGSTRINGTFFGGSSGYGYSGRTGF